MHRQDIPLVAAINDISGFGRCSLTVAIPVLSAMGIQACPLPTAILSNHTGYESCFFYDFTPHIDEYAQQWQKRGLRFSAIYTGFLGSPEQARKIADFLRTFATPQTLALVDPAMADNGALYSTCHNMPPAMRELVKLADIITPNLTEACLLTDTDYHSLMAQAANADFTDRLYILAEALVSLGPKRVVVTGIPLPDGSLCNLCLDTTPHAPRRQFCIASPRAQGNYSGTGDVFASVLCGRLVRGDTLAQAVEAAAAFVYKATAFSAQNSLPGRDGIAFEPFLQQLAT